MNNSELKAATQSAQLRHILDASPLTLTTAVLLALILAYAQRAVIEVHVILMWLSLTIIVYTARAALAYHHKRIPLAGAAIIKARLMHLRVGTLLAGATWGSAGFLLYPTGNTEHQFLLIVMLAGLTAGGVISHAIDRSTSILYSVLILIPLIVHLMFDGGSLNVALGTSISLYLIFMVFSLLKIHRGMLENIALRLEAESHYETLKTSEKSYRSLLAHLPIGIFHFDTNLVISYCNEDFAKLMHMPVDFFIGLDMKSVKDQAILPALRKTISGEIGHYEGRFHSDKDADIWIDMTCAPSWNGAEKIVGGVGIIKNISERKRAELKMREHETVLRQAQEDLERAQSISHTGSWRIDIPSGKLEWSAETFRIFGMPNSRTIDLDTFESRVHPDDLDRMNVAWKAALKGAPYDIEHRIVIDGQTRWVRELAEIIFGSDGLAISGIGAVQDITDRKLAEIDSEKYSRQLEADRLLFQTILDSAPIGIWMLGVDGKIKFINRTFCESVGVTEQQFKHAQHYSDVLPPAVAANCMQSDRECFESETTLHISLEHLPFVDGKQHLLEITKVKIFDHEGLNTGLIGLTVDITERKNLEDELRSSRQTLRDLAEKTERLREQERKHIAREVHDELGQVLTALRMDVALINLRFGEQSPGLLSKTNDMSDLLDRAYECVRNIVSDLRPYALESGIIPALEWLCEEFRNRSGNQCVLITPEESIELNEGRSVAIFRIVQELLTNVSRHAGGCSVEISLLRCDDMLRVQVRDDGLGFDPNAKRNKNSFGLVGIHERAISLGGGIEFVSAPNQGTIAVFTMPLERRKNDPTTDRR